MRGKVLKIIAVTLSFSLFVLAGCSITSDMLELSKSGDELKVYISGKEYDLYSPKDPLKPAYEIYEDENSLFDYLKAATIWDNGTWVNIDFKELKDYKPLVGLNDTIDKDGKVRTISFSFAPYSDASFYWNEDVQMIDNSTNEVMLHQSNCYNTYNGECTQIFVNGSSIDIIDYESIARDYVDKGRFKELDNYCIEMGNNGFKYEIQLTSSSYWPTDELYNEEYINSEKETYQLTVAMEILALYDNYQKLCDGKISSVGYAVFDGAPFDGESLQFVTYYIAYKN